MYSGAQSRDTVQRLTIQDLVHRLIKWGNADQPTHLPSNDFFLLSSFRSEPLSGAEFIGFIGSLVISCCTFSSFTYKQEDRKIIALVP